MKTVIMLLVLLGHSQITLPDTLTTTLSPMAVSTNIKTTITLVGKSTSSNQYALQSWTWDYGDGVIANKDGWCSNLSNCSVTVYHAYTKSGIYTVTFSTVDIKGTKGSATSVIKVLPISCVNTLPICSGGLLPQTLTATDRNNYTAKYPITGCRFTQPPRCPLERDRKGQTVPSTATDICACTP